MFTLGFIISVYFNIPLEHFTKDPATVHAASSFVGVFSYFGVLGWCLASSVCFFTSLIHFYRSNRKLTSFFFFSGLFNFVLMMDDLFMIHERLIPKYLFIPEKIVYIFYLIAFIIYILNFKSVFLKTNYIFLIIAVLFFGISILCDLFLKQFGNFNYIEDALKFYGIVTWAFFLIQTCYLQIK